MMLVIDLVYYRREQNYNIFLCLNALFPTACRLLFNFARMTELNAASAAIRQLEGENENKLNLNIPSFAVRTHNLHVVSKM